jgi:hypothetical protein
MTARALLVVAAALLAAVFLLRDIGSEAPPPPARPRARPMRAARPGGAPVPESTRNVFEYAPRVAAAPAPRPAAVASGAPPVVQEPVAPGARLVGLVRRGGVLKAALQVHGETVVVGVGEDAGDYRVVAIDEDGVRLRAGDGTILTLPTGGS